MATEQNVSMLIWINRPYKNGGLLPQEIESLHLTRQEILYDYGGMLKYISIYELVVHNACKDQYRQLWDYERRGGQTYGGKNHF